MKNEEPLNPLKGTLTTPNPSKGGKLQHAKDKYLHAQKSPLGDLGVGG